MKEISVIGIGPGSYENLTIKADKKLSKADVIVGYTVYVELVKEYYPNKEYITTSMKQEVERCRIAFEQAATGKNVAMVCSGDAGVYGMAGLMYQIQEEYPDIELEIIPGITAALAGGAVLGAPLTHDFAVISLSDLLTPFETIMQRVESAAKADFCICLYNPSSKKRSDYLKKACECIMKYKDKNTVCGYVKNIDREGEQIKNLSLEELASTQVDMFTTVFIGNKNTFTIAGHMVTPRGYEIK